MEMQLSWKTILIALVVLTAPQFAGAKQAKNKPTMFEVVEKYISGQPTPNAILKIKVYDEDSQPISGAVVKLKRHETGDDKTLRTTDSFGSTENSAPKSEYEIEISKPGYAATSKFILLDRGLTESIVLKKLDLQNIAEHSDRMPASVEEVLELE